MAKNNELITIEDKFDNSFGLDLLSDLKSDASMIGLENLDASDVKMPKIKLMQPTSLEVTKGLVSAGHFYNTVTKESYESLPCILLYMGKTRVKWKDKFKRGDEPLCRSFDGEKSIDGVLCANCPDSHWDNSPDAESKKSLCNKSLVWLGLMDTPQKTPFRIIMSGMSVSPTLDFSSMLLINRLEPFYFKINLTSEFKENDKGSFYVAKYPDIRNCKTIIHDTLDSLGFTPADAKDAVNGPIFLAERDKRIKEFKDIVVSLKELFFKAAEKDTVDISNAIELNPEQETETKENALF